MKKLQVLVISIFLLILAGSVLAAHGEELELPEGIQKLKDHQINIALSVSFLAAFLAGATAVLSPCGFVLLPMFFSYAYQEKKKAVAMTSYFSLGLVAAFTLFGVVAGIIGVFLNSYKTTFALISGILLIGFGVLLFLNKGFSFYTPKIKEDQSKWGLFILGFLFAIGWTPCVGAILGGILILASLTGSMLKSVVMMAIYGLGSAVPLMILAYFSDKTNLASKVQGKVREVNLFGGKIVTNTYSIIASLLLIAIGVIIIIYQGTRFFQIYLPWNMKFWTWINERLLEGFWTSSAANVLGVLIVLGVVWFIIRSLKKKISL